ncbi:MAG: polysaccharide biosynthesis tyrosine autokinase [Dysgonamonadaceae bacterium]|jgi:capsular exopolysaccharide synthesis family protein|nr:polysaccharide biosynthesis tyrosine autokinase [Dysgonamonadaceae bacterium]
MENNKQMFTSPKEERDVSTQWFIINILMHWKWIFFSLALCVALGIVYLKFTKKIYKINASVILKDEKKGGLGNSELSLFESMGLFNTNNNVDNEVEMLKSRNLVEGVVKEQKLYINYLINSGLEKQEIYGNKNPHYPELPIDVYMSPEKADRISGAIVLNVNLMKDSSILVEGEYGNENFSQIYAALPAVMQTPVGEVHLQSIENLAGEENREKIKGYPDKPGIMETPVGNVRLTPSKNVKLKGNYPIKITIKNPVSVAKAYIANLQVSPASKTTSIVRLSLLDTHPERGEDFLNKLIDLYNRDAIEDKNKAALNASEFITERLRYINEDLNISETDIEAYKRNNRLTDIASESNLFLVEGNDFDKQLSQTRIQLQLVNFLQDEVKKVSSGKGLLPGTLGISDERLSDAVNKYNTAVSERERLLKYSSMNSPAVTTLDEKIISLRENISSGIDGVEVALQAREKSLSRQANRYDSQISNIPKRERELTEKKRQQQIKETLYMMLLQKKEEATLSLAVAAPSAKVIESPLAGETPVSPKPNVVMLASLLVGLFIPISVIGVKDLFSLHVETEEDLKRLSDIPLLVGLPMDKSKKHLVVTPHAATPVAETFRLLRSNLQFYLNSPEKKVILITSSISGEGKTFVSINLAMTFSLKYKTVLVGMDIRRPKLDDYLNLSRKSGVVDYLSGVTDNVDEIIVPSGLSENLDIIQSGSVPLNPNELLMEPTLDLLFAELRRRYDYIIVDTSPVGSVSDTFLTDRVTDATLFIVRSGFTPKTGVSLINDMNQEHRLKKMMLVLNGISVNLNSRYGYGRRYGYGYGYGSAGNKAS